MRYMMATKAFHTLGNISSDKPSLCLVIHENDKNYIGLWKVSFIGLVNVQFPKKSTRILTEKEMELYISDEDLLTRFIELFHIKKEGSLKRNEVEEYFVICNEIKRREILVS